MSEESVSYGKEPKYKIGEKIFFVDKDSNEMYDGTITKTFPNECYEFITDNDMAKRYYWDGENVRVLQDLDYGVSYVADKPMETPEHYKMAIEPIEFAMKNGLGICEFNILKYICRFKRKNGKDDLLKARHYLDMLIKYEYPEVQDLDSGKLPTF